MKLLIVFLFISTACNAQTGFMGVEVFPTLNQRLGHGAPYFGGSLPLDSIGVLEPEIIRRTTDDTIRILYTGMRADGTTAVFLATTDSIGGTLTKWGEVIGRERQFGGVYANCTGAVFYQDTLFAFCARGYSDAVHLYKSVDGGHTFGSYTIAFDRPGIIPNTLGYGNSGILKDTAGAAKQIGGKFRMYIEANEGFHWMTYLCEATSLNGPWTYIQNISSLRINGGSYSGGAPIWLDGVTHVFFHYSPSGVSVLPTYLAYAYSSDGINFTQNEAPFKYLEAHPYGTSNPNDLQIADMSFAQVRGNVYMIAEYFRNNVTTIHSVIYRWKYKGTFKQLITNLQTCIGCAGIYP